MALTSRMIHQAALLSKSVYQHPNDWMLLHEPGVTWLAIEGTDCAVDWRRNLEFVFTSDDTHAGFANYTTRLMAEMLACGWNFRRNDQLVVCGHSLGGAVATIIAAQLQDHVPQLDLVTFGSPRPGGRRFRDRLRVPHHRYVHGDDVVPHLPAAALGFRHTAPPQVLAVEDDSLLHGVDDHDMSGYLEALMETLT